MADAAVFLLLIILSVGLVAFGRLRKIKLITLSGLLIPTLYSGLRLNVGTDFPRYVLMYQEITNISLAEYIAGYTVEPSLYVIAMLSKALFDSPLLIFILLSALTIGFFYKGLLKHVQSVRHVTFALFAYLLIIFPNTMNISRQGVAISVAFYAFTFIPERRFGKYLTWMIVASLFHYSTIVLLPAYFLNRVISKKISDSYSRVKILALSLMMAFALPILAFVATKILPIPEKYANYVTTDGAGANALFFVIGGVTLILVAMVSLYRGKKGPDALYPYAYSMIAASLLFAGFFVAETRRFALYFIPYIGIFIPIVIGMLPKGVARTIAWAIANTYVLTYFLMFYVLMGYGDIFPYQSIFQGGY